MLFIAKRIRENEDDGMIYYNIELGNQFVDIAIRSDVHILLNENQLKSSILCGIFEHSGVIVK